MRTRKFLSTLIPALPMLLAALLVILVTVIFLTAMRSKAHAQFGGVEQPMFQLTSVVAASYAPTNELGARYWWVASDNPTNIVITNWIDRIQGELLTNTAALAPTNSSTGIGFAGNTYLRPSNHFICITGQGQTGTVMVICAPITPTTTYGPILAGDNNIGDTGGYGLYARNNANFWVWGIGGNGSMGAYASGATYDLIYAMDQIGTCTFYTNGVISINGTSRNGWAKNGFVGFDPSASWFYKGKIIEIFWSSNKLDSVSVSNLHHYATNTYGYSP